MDWDLVIQYSISPPPPPHHRYILKKKCSRQKYEGNSYSPINTLTTEHFNMLLSDSTNCVFICIYIGKKDELTIDRCHIIFS